jgi:precorrin-3B C17-methyltransferase
VLYNPKSKRRRRQLGEAAEIFRAARPGSTPVGIVTAAGREEQSLVVTDLDHLCEQAVDMRSVVIIGNTSTRAVGNWLVTARGYQL